MNTLDDLLKQENTSETDAFPDEIGPMTDSPLTEARLLAIQALFQYDLMSAEDEEFTWKMVKADFFHVHINNREADDKLFKAIIEQAEIGLEDTIKLISACLTTNWSYDRLGRLERSLLIAACCEFSTRANTPYKVIINEFVTISKAFLDERGSKLMNGLLNTIAGQLRTTEVEAKTGKKIEMIDLNPPVAVEETEISEVEVATSEDGEYASDYANMESSEDK